MGIRATFKKIENSNSDHETKQKDNSLDTPTALCPIWFEKLQTSGTKNSCFGSLHVIFYFYFVKNVLKAWKGSGKRVHYRLFITRDGISFKKSQKRRERMREHRTREPIDTACQFSLFHSEGSIL